MRKADLTPMSTEIFTEKRKISNSDKNEDEINVFLDSIEKISAYATAPFFWFVPNNFQMRIKWASESVKQLTPFTTKQWVGADPKFFADLYHVDDRFYVFSAITAAYQIYSEADDLTRAYIKFNIYGRLLDRNKNYRWTLLQINKFHINTYGQIESGLYIVYDLSSLHIKNSPVLSVISYGTADRHFYKQIEKWSDPIEIGFHEVTKREKEILKLMSQGLNTPQISNLLHISYHTVENHKRNLRRKTNTKTSAELIAFAMVHHLIAISPIMHLAASSNR